MVEGSRVGESGLRRALAALWRYRALVAGLIAFALAALGEDFMRPANGQPAPNPALGLAPVQVAVLLVGLVAWVREGLRLPGRKAAPPPAPAVPPTPRRIRAGAPGP